MALPANHSVTAQACVQRRSAPDRASASLLLLRPCRQPWRLSSTWITGECGPWHERRRGELAADAVRPLAPMQIHDLADP